MALNGGNQVISLARNVGYVLSDVKVLYEHLKDGDKTSIAKDVLKMFNPDEDVTVSRM